MWLKQSPIQDGCARWKQFDATWNGGVEQEILHSLRAFQVDDRYVPDGKRKGWVDDGRFKPDAEWRAGWMTGMRMGQMVSGRIGSMTDGSGRMRNGVPGG